LLCRFWRHWRELLIIVKPDTVVRWHKQGFRLFWKRESRHGGRSPGKKEIRDLVRKMARSNPFWVMVFFAANSHLTPVNKNICKKAILCLVSFMILLLSFMILCVKEFNYALIR